MNKMSKTVLIIIVVLLCILSAVFYSAYGFNEKNDNSSKWTYLDDNYYKVLITADDNSTLLYKHIQDKDIIEIQNKLIDHTREPDKKLAETVNNDPNAVLPDNMLSDGSFLVDDWFKLYPKYLNDSASINVLNQKKGRYDLQSIPKEYIEKTLGEVKSTMVIASFDGHKYLLPSNMDYNPGCLFSSDSSFEVYVGTDSIYKFHEPFFEPEALNLSVITEESLIPGQQLFLNESVCMSPDNEIIAFISNKEDYGECDVYIITKDGNETKIADGVDEGFNIYGWIDDNNILCVKHNDAVIVNIDGSLINIPQIASDDYYVASGNGYFAFTDISSISIYRLAYGEVSLLNKFNLDGTIRLRGGIDAFNPSVTRLAAICNDDENGIRGLIVYSINNQKLEKVVFSPIGDPKEKSIHEFEWINDKDILVSLKDKNTKEISSWIYHCDE